MCYIVHQVTGHLFSLGSFLWGKKEKKNICYTRINCSMNKKACAQKTNKRFLRGPFQEVSKRPPLMGP